MADLTITAANIIPVSGYSEYQGTAGATITAGQVVYLDSNSLLQLADNNGAAALATVKGIALHAALANQPLKIIIAGSLGFGAILTAGNFYYLSETAGAICPWGDLGAGERVSQIGYASTTSNMVLNIVNTGVAL
jgi:hypothetical protein